MSQMRIEVVNVIRDPLGGRKLEPGTIKRVPTTSYWLKRKKCGDVVLCDEKKVEKTKVATKNATAKSNNAKEGASK